MMFPLGVPEGPTMQVLMKIVLSGIGQSREKTGLSVVKKEDI